MSHLEPYRTTGTSPGHAGTSSSSSRSAVTATHVVRRTLTLDHAGTADVGFRFDEHGPTDAPTVVVLGGISSSRHILPTADDPTPGWWPGVVGRGFALDPTHHRLIGVDYLGAPGGTAPGGSHTTTDQARLVLAALDALEVDSATVVGGSYGGMVALALAALAPDRVAGLVVACAAHRPHPMATALRAIQRDIVRAGIRNGDLLDAVALARALAMTTYRSVPEFEARFWGAASRDAEGVLRFPVEAYLTSRGAAFAQRFSADRYLTLSDSIDLHDVPVEAVTPPTVLLSFDTDAIVPPFLAAELAAGAPGIVEHVRSSSLYGHDAFLKETEDMAQAIGLLLDERHAHAERCA